MLYFILGWFAGGATMFALFVLEHLQKNRAVGAALRAVAGKRKVEIVLPAADRVMEITERRGRGESVTLEEEYDARRSSQVE